MGLNCLEFELTADSEMQQPNNFINDFCHIPKVLSRFWGNSWQMDGLGGCDQQSGLPTPQLWCDSG